MKIWKNLRRTAAVVALLVPLLAPSTSLAVGSYNNANIANKALSYVGQWGGNACNDAQKPGDITGQCRSFVNCIVWMVSGHTQNLGGVDYYQPFLDAGGIRITNEGSLTKGDIVQVGEGTHTFIVVSRVSGNTFNVVDSNHAYDEMVMNYSLTFTLDSTTRAYRMGAVFGSGGSAGTLWFIKTKNVGTGHVEVHSATPATNYQNGQHSVTWFSPVDASNGWFQMVGSDLYFIKTRNVGSGHIEIHSATATSGYQNGQHSVTWFSPADAGNGWFQMAGADLYFIKTRNTGSGRVEVHSATAASGYRSGVHYATPFSATDASNGWFQMQGRDLVFIKTRNTGTGRVEYFRSPASTGYSQVTVATPTAFSPVDQNNGWFSSEDVDRDGRGDLMFVKTHNPGSGHVELFEASGASGYQQVIHSIVTWLSPADANNGWFQINSKQ